MGADSDLGTTVSSAHTGTETQDNLAIIMNAVTVDRMSIRYSLLDFNGPAMTRLRRLV
ncbi:MAG: hypothetical protein IT389_06550 [Nitrospira sp.]|nr:hypothetical protein [Nitrospira sp.]